MEDKPNSFRLKKIINFNWLELDNQCKLSIFKSFIEFPLQDKEPNQHGFVKCTRLEEDFLFGYFTHQSSAERHRYNSEKVEEIYEDTPFEDIFFIILFDLGYCLIQDRKFFDSTLKMSNVLKHFERDLELIFERVGISYYGLKDFTKLVSKEEFIKAFKDNNVLSLEIEELNGKQVPEDFKLANPHVDVDRIRRSMINESCETLNKLSISGTKKGGLQNSKLHEAFLRTGMPNRMEFLEIGKKYITVLIKKWGPIIKLEINVESPNEKQIKDEISKSFSLDRSSSAPSVKETQTTLFECGRNERK